MKLPAIALLLDEACGVYIPHKFVENFDLTEWGIDEDSDVVAVLREGPEHEHYWDAWDEVLRDARYDAGHTLHHDGGLFAVCDDKMTDEEYMEFYRESRSDRMSDNGVDGQGGFNY
jgi:hypothetical protein